AKLHNAHAGGVITGARALWEDNMRLLAVWVALCGAIAPALLLGCLAALAAPARVREEIPGVRWLWRAAHALEHWSMPEVHVLAVLVAFTKLGALVDVHVGLGLWC